MARRTHAAAMLEALSDGRPWSTHELVEYGVGYAAHSRASDLRKLGYAIKSSRRTVPGENPVYFYELQSVPPAGTRVEELVEPAAAARLQELRVAQGDSVLQYPRPAEGESRGSGQEPASLGQAGRAGRPGVTGAFPPQPAAVSTPRAAAGPSSQTLAWVAELRHELAGIDGEIASLRSQLFLDAQDSARIDLLLARGGELQARLDGLEERAA